MASPEDLNNPISADRAAYQLRNNLAFIEDALREGRQLPIERWNEFLAQLPMFMEAIYTLGNAQGLPMSRFVLRESNPVTQAELEAAKRSLIDNILGRGEDF